MRQHFQVSTLEMRFSLCFRVELSMTQCVVKARWCAPPAQAGDVLLNALVFCDPANLCLFLLHLKTGGTWTCGCGGWKHQLWHKFCLLTRVCLTMKAQTQVQSKFLLQDVKSRLLHYLLLLPCSCHAILLLVGTWYTEHHLSEHVRVFVSMCAWSSCASILCHVFLGRLFA